jgi:hypothetical protein
MATTPTVLGHGPLEYTDPVTGKQVSIPLTALFFDPTKGNQLAIDSTKWPDPSTTTINLPGFIQAFLKDLVQQQLVIPAPVPAPKQSMVLTASSPGSTGNSIKITITTTPKPDPTQSTFDVKVEESDTYTGLTLATIAGVLGTDKAAGSIPGLLHIVQGTLAASGLPGATASPVALAVGGGGPSAQAVLNNNAKTPAPFVTVEAKKPGADGALTTVSIANVDTTKNTFDLTAFWTKTVTGCTLATLLTNLAGLSYEIGVSPPLGGIFSVPVSGVVTLSGGADGSSPTAASAIVFAG